LENVSVLFLQHGISALPSDLNYSAWKNVFVPTLKKRSFPVIQSPSLFWPSRHIDAIISEPGFKIVDFDFTLANFGYSLYFKANYICI
jgi:hypothetical protein